MCDLVGTLLRLMRPTSLLLRGAWEEIQDTTTAWINTSTAVLEVPSKMQALVDDRKSYVNPYTIP